MNNINSKNKFMDLQIRKIVKKILFMDRLLRGPKDRLYNISCKDWLTTKEEAEKEYEAMTKKSFDINEFFDEKTGRYILK